MQEIEIGEYVRYEGKIYKVVEKQKYDYNYKRYYIKIKNVIEKEVFVDVIEKHSKNIIDLIEVGDLIKLKGEEKLKYEVLKISYSKEKGKHIHIINPFRTEGGKDIFIEDIKSIVTHEQFESIEYKIQESEEK